MLRGAGPKHPHGRGGARPAVRLGRRAIYEGRTAGSTVLGFCGLVLSGGIAMFAFWELGNFAVPFGSGSLGPAAVREDPAPAGVFRPAGETRDTDAGCTQAPIDRSSGQTTPTDCHTWTHGRETMTALLSNRTAAP
jgi:hypothetical protein